MTPSPRLVGVFAVCFAAALCALPVRADAGPAVAHTLVVLVPGFAGRAEFPVGRYFMELDDALRKSGFDTVTLAPPAVGSSEERGAWLKATLDEVLAEREGASRVLVIAHSQGGVDTRAALDMGARIDAVATLSTPHHGTDVAEVALAWPRPLVRAALYEVGMGAPRVQHADDDEALLDADRALTNLTRAGMAKFNAHHPSSPVPFFSVAAFSGADVDDACTGGRWSRPKEEDALHPMLLIGRAMIRSQRNVSDDGVVPTNSMRFGTFLGCVPADHVDWQRWDVEPAESGERASFDAIAFIAELARGLDDVAASHDERAMDDHVAKLASLARAAPRP